MVALASALLTALAWSLLAIPLGFKLGIVDRPDPISGLKSHSEPTSLLGGVGILAAFLVGSALAGEFDIGLALSGLFILLVGLADDIRGLAPGIRLAAAATAGVLLMSFASVPPAYESPTMFIFGVALVLVAVNAVNLLDGMDGLAASVGTVSAFGIAVVAALKGASAWTGLVLAAALLGFLALNRYPARVFMGDGGAYSVGLILSYGVIKAAPGAGVPAFLAVGLLGVFLIDLAATIVRRTRAKQPLFGGDRRHVYDHLHDHGWSVPVVVLATGIAQALVVALVALLSQVPLPWLQLVLLAVFSTLVLGALGRSGLLGDLIR